MNLNNTLIVLVILLSIFSCKAQRETDVREYFISHKNAGRPVSDIIESYELIQLEETEGAFFSNARRIIFSDEKIIILTSDNRILTFSESGEFIGSIDKQGRGPDEYEVLSDICLFNNVHLTGEGQFLFDIRMPGDKDEYDILL